MRTAYRVIHAPEGSDPSYCGEFDSLTDAQAYAATEPDGLESSLHDTARAAGHCAGMHAPDTAGDESPEAISWHGSDGWHCVCRVTYS